MIHLLKESIKEWPEKGRTGLCAVIASALLVGLLSACGGGGSGPAPPVLNETTCTQLATVPIPATSIGMPTTGGAVTATKWVAASGTGANALPDYCLVSGKIMPYDPAAYNTEFKVALPASASWNKKVLMLGGGGFDGSIPNVLGRTNLAPSTVLTPLGRGYAVFGSDGGHQNATLPNPAHFMLNEEAYRNWAGDALKKTRDAAIILVKAAYGSAPSKSYFVGGSYGGHEALAVAARWPADWDGVVSLYPAQPVTASLLGHVNASKALAAPGAFSNAAKRTVLRKAALAACDSLDGVNDGVIGNVRGCDAIFNPSTALLDGVPIRCPGGADTGDTCLSDAQITALNIMNSPLNFNFPLASGQTSFPGFPVFTTDLGITSDNPLEVYVTWLNSGAIQPAFPVTPGVSGMWYGTYNADTWLRYAVTGDLSFNYLTFDPANPGAFALRLSELSALDAQNTNMTGFQAKGGKVLLLHGLEDIIIPARSTTELYYQNLQAIMGSDKVDTFLRYYQVPGMGHYYGTTFFTSWDELVVIENWVENGVDPKSNQIITDTVGVPGRTRPLCTYPSWPKYKGSGDVNSAASFTCSRL